MPDSPSEPINEATLEARMGAALKGIFPGLQDVNLDYQRNIRLKLGHESIVVDGFRNRDKTGRLDVAVILDGRPIAVLELKQPEEPLDNEVSRQALSYARSLDCPQPPPLVVVSNGEQTQFFKTWDGKLWEPEAVTEEIVQGLIAEAGKIASAALDDCVRHLLEIDDTIWRGIIEGLTRSALAAKTGRITEVVCPIVEGFHIHRTAEGEITSLIERGDRKVALVGEPFSGKTCVLGALCRQSADQPFTVLYLDAADSSEGLISRIAGYFTSHFFKEWTIDRTRTWLSTRLQHCRELNLVVAIDGIDAVSQGSFRADLDLFARLAEEGILAFLIAGNERIVDQLSTQAGTQARTMVGRGLAKVELPTQLSNSEWGSVQGIFERSFKAIFSSSPEQVFELRCPRLLRLLASTVKIPDEYAHFDNAYAVLRSLPHAQDFEKIWTDLTGQTVREDFLALARTFLSQPQETSDAGFLLTRLFHSAIDIDHLNGSLSEAIVERMTSRGYLRMIFDADGFRAAIPNPQEFMAVASAVHLRNEFLETFRESGIDQAVDNLVNETEFVPYSSTVCAMAISLISRSNPRVGFETVRCLLKYKPTMTVLGQGAKLGVMAIDGDLKEVDLGDVPLEEDAELIGNLHPWLALADVFGFPMKGEGEHMFEFRRMIIGVIGSFPRPMIRTHESPWPEPPPIFQHQINPRISLLCPSSGQLEPLSRVIDTAFAEDFQGMNDLVEEELRERNIPLLHRLLASLNFLKNTTSESDEDSFAKLAGKIEKGLSKLIGESIDGAVVDFEA